MTIFCFWYLVFGILIFFPNENQFGFHMRYHLFLHYGWFLQEIGQQFLWIHIFKNVVF